MIRERIWKKEKEKRKHTSERTGKEELTDEYVRKKGKLEKGEKEKREKTITFVRAHLHTPNNKWFRHFKIRSSNPATMCVHPVHSYPGMSPSIRQ